MKRIVLALALLLPAAAFAQTMEWGARASVEANYKIMKGLHVYAEEEMRASDMALSSMRTTLGVTYKPSKAVKVGVGYTLINPYQATSAFFKSPRHRFFVDASGSLRSGDFQFTLKERLQLTHRTGSFNVYQTTPNALALKSKFTTKYKRWNWVEPYASLEMRTALNDPWGTTSGSAQWNSKNTKTYFEYTHTGYTHIYNNRYRAELGADFNFVASHMLRPYLLFDYCSDYQVDTNSEGTHLFNQTTKYVNTMCLSVGLSYVFSF